MSIPSLPMRAMLAFAVLTQTVAGPAFAAPFIASASFEDPDVGAAGYQYAPTVAGATFNTKTGVAQAGSPFGSASPSDGNQFAFLQSVDEARGSINLDVLGLTAGTIYNFTFDAALRPGYVGNIVSLFFDGTPLGSFDASSSSQFDAFTTSSFTALDAGGVLTFTGAPTTTGDNAILIDNIRINAADAVAGVPEPATWAMMIIGFGIVCGALRRRRTASAMSVNA